jgi:hypothetical protein
MRDQRYINPSTSTRNEEINKQLNRTSKQADKQATNANNKRKHPQFLYFKMKFTIIVNALFLALWSHLALASTIGNPSLMAREDNVDVSDNNSTAATSFGNIVSSVLDNGKHKIEFFDVDGTLEVTAIETDDGGTSPLRPSTSPQTN